MDLKTTYLGLELEHPIVASSSPLSKNLDGVMRLADGGAAAITMFSIFEEQLRHENETLEFMIGRSAFCSSESLTYFPEIGEYDTKPTDYLELVHRAARATGKPIIASLNGVTAEGWFEYAKDVEDAGASAIELNIFFLPVDPHTTSADVEQQYVDVVNTVRGAVKIPIVVKLSPFLTSVGNMCHRLVKAGANGVVLFNRFYQPDFNLETRMVESRLELSQPHEIRLPLLWIAALYGKLHGSIGATTGVETSEEVVKYLLAGADAVMTTASLLRHGEQHLTTLRQGLEAWMEAHGATSVAQFKGSMSLLNCAEPEALVRANYIKMLRSYERTRV